MTGAMNPADNRLEIRPFPPELKARLRVAAKQERRSLSSFVIVTLDAALHARDLPPDQESAA